MVQLHEHKQLPHSQIGATPAAVVQHRCIVIALFIAITTACSLYQTPPVSLSSYLVITSKATSREGQLVLRFQVSEREPGDCWYLQQEARTAKHCFPLSTKHNILLLLCTSQGNRTGSLFINNLDAACSRYRRTPPATPAEDATSNTSWASPPVSVYRLRIVGAEILQPAIHDCGCMAAAKFRIQGAAGDYSLELLQLYRNFTTIAPPLLMRDMYAATFKLVVEPEEGGPSTRGKADPAPDSACNTQGPAACQMCTGFNHTGRWVLTHNSSGNTAAGNAAAALLQALQHTCVRQLLPEVEFKGCPLGLRPPSLPSVEDNELLEWLPHNCRYHKLTPVQQAACHAGLSRQGKVCFIGDSQTRLMYNQVVHLIEGPAARFRAIFTGGEHDEKHILASATMAFVYDTYGDGILALNSSNCSHVFANFGQWPLSYFEEQPWSTEAYTQKITQIARRFQQLQARYGNKHYWVTTNPFPMAQHQQQEIYDLHEGIDWRTEPFVMLYNAAASRVMHAHGIPVADTFSIAAPLVDLSYDGAHFLGTVGLAQARMLANILCSSVWPHTGA